MAVMSAMGAQNRIISVYAPEDVKRRFLPGVVSGDTILAICMTEPHAGTDVANYRTNTVVHNDRVVLNGTKTGTNASTTTSIAGNTAGLIFSTGNETTFTVKLAFAPDLALPVEYAGVADALVAVQDGKLTLLEPGAYTVTPVARTDSWGSAAVRASKSARTDWSFRAAD